VERAAAAASLVVVCLLVFGLDRYRRLDLSGPKDGPRVLAVIREGYRTASRLDRGLEVRFGPDTHTYAWGRSDPGRLGRMRWFLEEGWGEMAHYGLHHITMRATRSSLLLPCLRPQDLQAVVVLHARREARLAVFVNDQAVGDVHAGPDPPESVVEIPAEVLFRGDNVVTLVTRGGLPGLIRLRRLCYRPAPGGS
jgi:hypothetical protein